MMKTGLVMKMMKARGRAEPMLIFSLNLPGLHFSKNLANT